MSRFNLISEPWISVVTNRQGSTELVSLEDIFENSPQYEGLGGDTLTQDFAVFRLLLAILSTIFSRFDAEGRPYKLLNLDDNFQPTQDIDEDDAEEYIDALMNTWATLWMKQEFPGVIKEYFKLWNDRFFLFDEQYPFYQVKASDIEGEKINRSRASAISGKNINRLISESGNKVALFSPKHDANKNKERLTAPEVARWLLTFHAYTGLSDKVIFGKQKYKASKGWPYDLGAIYLQGENLFQSLLLNCLLVHPYEEYQINLQKPCWEFESNEVIERLMSQSSIDNLAELYSNWSRAIYINPEFDLADPFECEIVKLPEISHKDNFLEPMTLWRFNTSGENKDFFTPRKHRFEQSLWRSFGLMALPHSESSDHRLPAVIRWSREIQKIIGNYDLTICALSMQDDGNATSWVPTDEIYDSLTINDLVLTDIREAGWIPRINDAVEKTKKVVGFIYQNYISEIRDIRNISSSDFVRQKVEELYFCIDEPFKLWLSSLSIEDSMELKTLEWEQELRQLTRKQADSILECAGPQDFVGTVIEKDGQVMTKNIATAYNKFVYFLNKEIPPKEEKREHAT